MILTETSTINLANFIDQTNFPKRLKAIFFDMDGVLFDSMPNHELSWIHAFEPYGVELPKEEAYLHEGSPAFATAKIVLKKFKNELISDETAAAIKKRKHDYMKELPQSPVMQQMPELMQILSESNIHRWVVTGSSQSILIDRLENEYDQLLDRQKMVTALEVKIGKPHPDPYLIAMQKSGFDSSNSIVVENAPLGVQSAKAAGLFTIAINTGPLDPKLLSNAGADLVLPNSTELFDLMKRLLPLVSQ